MKVFDLEQQIMECWGVVDDIKTVYSSEHLYENTDEMQNALLGLYTLYDLKFNQLFSLYEKFLAER